MKIQGAFISILIFFVGLSHASYRIGVGISDVTGPIVGVTFIGYGNFEQQGSGLHLRQWSRAFVIDDGERRIVFVSIDAGMMADGVRIQVLKTLEEKYSGTYTSDNVMISATHTHSGVGGFLMHTLFDFSSLGFSKEAFGALVSGIVKSIVKAHENLQEGRIFLSKGTVLDANLNRSPNSYEANPQQERDRYQYNVDKDLVQMKFISNEGTPLGVINWFAVHPTSMNNTNTLVSSDNVGYASVKFEQAMEPGQLIGKGKFVAAFASSNLGDVSPNVMGPKCRKSGQDCDIHSSCPSMFDPCFAAGPGVDMFESTKIIGDRIFTQAWDLWNSPETIEITGPIRAVHQYVDMPKAQAQVYNKTSGKTETIRGCEPAMGYSFAAGTIDGPYASILQQGMTNSYWWLDTLRNVIGSPTADDIECHAPKPIILATGRMKFPFDWQPSIVSTQLGIIGNVALACVPGEFTTMSGRRIRDVIREVLGEDIHVVIAGLCNTYSDYITTFEEYQIQRYEGASTLFGPHTLALYVDQFATLARSLVTNTTLSRGPEPEGLNGDAMYSFIPPVVFDTPSWSQNFGDVLVEPEVAAQPGDVLSATFVAGHPRNDLKLDDTFCTVERQTGADEWTIVATDANWETKVHWRRTSLLLGKSEIDVEWSVPEDATPGIYRIRHFGHYKTIRGEIHPYQGTSKSLQVAASRNTCILDEWCKNVFLCQRAVSR